MPTSGESRRFTSLLWLHVWKRRNGRTPREKYPAGRSDSALRSLGPGSTAQTLYGQPPTTRPLQSRTLGAIKGHVKRPTKLSASSKGHFERISGIHQSTIYEPQCAVREPHVGVSGVAPLLGIGATLGCLAAAFQQWAKTRLGRARSRIGNAAVGPVRCEARLLDGGFLPPSLLPTDPVRSSRERRFVLKRVPVRSL